MSSQDNTKKEEELSIVEAVLDIDAEDVAEVALLGVQEVVSEVVLGRISEYLARVFGTVVHSGLFVFGGYFTLDRSYIVIPLDVVLGEIFEIAISSPALSLMYYQGVSYGRFWNLLYEVGDHIWCNKIEIAFAGVFAYYTESYLIGVLRLDNHGLIVSGIGTGIIATASSFIAQALYPASVVNACSATAQDLLEYVTDCVYSSGQTDEEDVSELYDTAL